jgi:hypothetical protein
MSRNPSGNSSPGGGFGSCGAHRPGGPLHGPVCSCHWCVDATLVPVGFAAQ